MHGMLETAMHDADARWKALVARDAEADGRFFYGVRTTGVFCRPSCASRLPRRENVLFFESAGAARAAGFRPCKRCEPTEASPLARYVAAVERACERLGAGGARPTLAALAREVGMSPYHFHRVFKQITGTTPGEYVRSARLGRFAEGLDAGRPVTEALYAAGWGSSSRAYEASSGLGMTPGARRRGGPGEILRFATAKTSMGWVLIAATARGICAAELGDDPAALAAGLRRRFPAARVREDPGALRAWTEGVVRFLVEPGPAPELPLDIRGTAFQARVWRALRRIPPGRTASYAEIARAVGRPDAVRAVSRAIAGNRLAVLVPCHRVVRSDGTLGGYRWGVERKEKLLNQEALAAMEADL